MANTGWQYPASADTGAIYSPGIGFWANPSYIKANDSNYATYYSYGVTGFVSDLRGYNYGYSIPSTAQIDGVKARLYSKANAVSSVNDNTVKLTKGAAFVGSSRNNAVYWGTGFAYQTYGSGTTDKWGLGSTLTPSYVNATDFGWSAIINFHTTYVTGSVNFYQQIIYYTTAPADPSGCAAVQAGANVNITWNDNSSDENYFEVQVDVNGGGYNVLSTTIPANSTAYTDTAGYTNGDTLTYRVRALKTSGPSSNWSTATAITYKKGGPQVIWWN